MQYYYNNMLIIPFTFLALFWKNNRARNVLPLWGPDDSFHLNPMLLQNTINSNYFQKCCRDLTDWNAVIDEIYYQVKYVEPFQPGAGTR